MEKSIPAIETKNLSISWGDVSVLNKINLKLAEGEKLAIVGPSGSGKSTLIDIILGLLIPNSGSLVLGENTISKNNTYLLQSRVGYVPQTIFLSDNTIKNNIAFGLDD